MSHPKSLEEYSNKELNEEIRRRKELKAKRRCTYCYRRLGECALKPCKLGPRT